MTLGIVNSKHDLMIVPGQESRHVLSDPTWPVWDQVTPMVLYAQQVALRVPVCADGSDVVAELNALDTVIPMPSTGYCIAAYHNDQMFRIASGFIRRT